MKKFEFKTFAIVLLAFHFIAYQNCSKNLFTEASVSKGLRSESGNGGNYDGKISYILADFQNLCSNGSPIRSRIEKINNSYILMKENCQDVAARALETSSIALDTSGQFLTYAGIAFIKDPIPSPLPTGTALPIPTNIANGTTVSLQCGQTYQGTLSLAGKSNITVQTVGTCGRALITPTAPISGWSQDSGNIYVANVSNQISQVFVDGQLLDEAHYPNSVSESGWVNPTGTSTDSISVSGLPNNDIVGARATFRSWDWQLGTRSITSFNGSTMTLSAMGSPGNYADDTPPGKFYLEGKLWMLDTAGEWAWANGKLYVWMPDGETPGERVLAASNVDAVDATGSSNVTLNNVRIFGGDTGVNGNDALALKVLNSEVAYSNDGISVKGASEILVDNSDVLNIVRSGVNGGWWSTNSTVSNSRVINANMVGMHKGSDGSIVFSDGSGAIVTNNIIINGGKSGISVGRTNGSLVKGNTIDNVCVIHANCGGIYTFAPDKLPLNTRIENNKLNNVTGTTVGQSGPARYAIYLNTYSNGVTVIGNTVTNGYTGMLIQRGFNNTISGNTFSGNTENHIFYSDSGSEGSMHNNSISYNMFVGPIIAHYFYVSNPATAASFNGNTYQNYGSSPIGNPSNLSY